MCKKLRDMQPEFEAQGISSVGLFGSVARDEATEMSDVDLAITIEPGVDLFTLAGVYLYAKEQLRAEVDLSFINLMNHIRRKSAEEDLIRIY